MPEDPVDNSIVDWLLGGARTATQPEEVLDELCRRLSEHGLPLARVAVFVNTLHPLLFGRSFIWRAGQGAQAGDAPLALLADDGFRRSAPVHVMRTGETIRRRLLDPDCQHDFPVLDQLVAEGCTDYLMQPLVFTDGRIQAVSWTTHHPLGFAPGHLATLEAIRQPFARIAEIYALRRVATTVLDTYVGRRCGERILSGSIHCGDIERIEAVVMVADLRGFTEFSNARPAEDVIARVNAFFDCCVPAVEAAGGEVLKFIGDGLLAILPIQDRGREVACAAALEAAAALEIAIRAHAGLQAPPCRYGVALHVGEVLYGNIGAGHRLDFTAMGPVVNKAARLEKLGSELGRTLVASSDVARHAGPALAPIGTWHLKGFAAAETVYALAAEVGG